MKRSLRHLPAQKRDDLRRLVEIIRQQVGDVVMVILYGSYARGTYVDYDQRVEFGVRTCFMSDYDVLIVTRRRLGVREPQVYERLWRLFFKDRAWQLQTPPQFINESIAGLNRSLDKGHYFYTDIKKEGILLYDSGESRLARRRKLDFDEIAKLAKAYFEDKFTRANDFLEDVLANIEKKKFVHASFHLHQAAENYLHAITLVFTLYGFKEHDPAKLMGRCQPFAPDVFGIFPQDNPEERRLFRLLQDAYVQSRYNKDFVVTAEDIRALIPRIERLRDIAERVCTAQIAHYSKKTL